MTVRGDLSVGGLAWTKSDLKELWPQFSGDEKPAIVVVVGDAVEDINVARTVCRRQKPGKVNPAGDLAVTWVNNNDRVRRPGVGKYFSIDGFELIQPHDRFAGGAYRYPALFTQGFRIEEKQLSGAVTHDQTIFKARKSPSFTRITEDLKRFKGCQVVDNPFFPFPCELDQGVVPIGQTFTEVVVIEVSLLKNFPRLKPDFS